MFAHDLHVALAWGTAAALAAIAVEAGVRTVRRGGPGRLAEAGLALTLVLIGMTSAAGLAMLVRGERPNEWLHFVYAILAFGLVPVADSLAAHGPHRAKSLARLGGALVALGVIIRLFATG
jgi:crotonobetainyl-CoA:carnitine CoA-transferase CaiB-like acyl-CoA transferase